MEYLFFFYFSGLLVLFFVRCKIPLQISVIPLYDIWYLR
jgi:hypothetical protein